MSFSAYVICSCYQEGKTVDPPHKMGGAAQYPILAKYLPEANGGILPSEFAQQALDELLLFEKEIRLKNEFQSIVNPLKRLAQASLRSGNPIHWI